MAGPAKHYPRDPAEKWADKEPLKPVGLPPAKLSLINEIEAGFKSPQEVGDMIIDEARGPLKQFCILPEGFASRKLGCEFRQIDWASTDQLDDLNDNPPAFIIDPKPPQEEAALLLNLYLAGDSAVCRNGDPFQPIFGANFIGKPGCGKTHLMSAFARRMKEVLDTKLQGYREMVAEFVASKYKAYQMAIAKVHNPHEPGAGSVWTIEGVGSGDNTQLLEQLKKKPGSEGEKANIPSLMNALGKIDMKVTHQKDPASIFKEELATFKGRLARMQYQPPDLLYLDFETLWELCRKGSTTRDQAYEALTRAKVVFVDDIHPKGEADKIDVALHVIEGRYTAGKLSTFITTNLSTQDLASRRRHTGYIGDWSSDVCSSDLRKKLKNLPTTILSTSRTNQHFYALVDRKSVV